MKIAGRSIIILLFILSLHTSFAAITVLTPNGNEQWRSGTAKKITWTTPETTTVRLEYQTSQGGVWNLIATSIPSQNLSYSWIVPVLESTACRVKVTNLANEADFDQSDTTFTITQVVQTVETESNNLASVGNWIEYGDSLFATIDPLGDVDYYRFWGAVNDTVEIWGHQRNNSGLGARISLFRADGARLTTNNGYVNPPYDQRIVWILQQSGVYYVRYSETSNWGVFPNRELVERLEQDQWLKMGKDLAKIQWDSTGDYTIGLRKLQPGGPVILQAGGFDYWWNAARFHGYIDTGGLPTTVRFEYGLDSNFDSFILPVGGPFVSAAPIWIESPIVTNLLSSTFYYMRIQATNALGTSISSPFQFSTVAPAEGWERKISGFYRTFADVQFVNSTTGIIAGDSLLIRTTDGGTTWTSVYPGTNWMFMHGLSFPDSLTGYAFGSYDHILKTTNGGLTWSFCSTGSGYYLKNGFFITAQVGWAIGDGGGIFKTVDGGSSWTPQNSGTTRQLMGIDFINPDTGMVVGDNIILRTINGGTTWTTITTSRSTVFRSIAFASPLVGVIAGDEPYLLRTADGGLTWTPITLTTWPDLDMYDVYFYNETAGIAVGWMGSIYRTTDGGLTWTAQTSGTVNNLFALSHAGTYTTIVGRSSAILHSVDYLSLQSPNGGESWGAGTTHNISWWSDLSGELLLQYRTSAGDSWTTIASGIPISSGSYAWTLPAVNSDSCRVRISTLPSGTFADISENVFSIHPTSVQQTILLSAGWNMISSYINPPDSTLPTLLLGPLGSHLTIAKNNSGQVYWPAYNINTIGKWNPLQGYKCYLTTLDTLIFSGVQLAPESTPINMTLGWNTVAYLRSTALTAPTALASISSYLTIAKNMAGQVYWPLYNINTIGNMQPGQGYQAYVTSACTLTYPANGLGLGKGVAAGTVPKSPQHFKVANQETGSSAILLVRAASLQDDDEVAAFGPEGQCLGAGVARGGQALVIIWGDDDQTKAIDGARNGDPLKLVFWSLRGGMERPLAIAALADGLNGTLLPADLTFQSDAIQVADIADLALLPRDYALKQNFPNPFNPSTSLRFELPLDSKVQLVIFNLRGQAIRTLVEGEKKAGYHEVVWDGRDQEGLKVASGLYLVRLEAGGFRQVIKMSFIK
ncbi:MAG TPA: YCF48-related protein [bacterium]|nr:YCF48-related protein [bacterium]HQJ65714.1 YCF48-related protein [bacterium]